MPSDEQVAVLSICSYSWLHKTVTRQLAETSPRLAVIVVSPALWAVIVPFSTVATSGTEESQTISSVEFAGSMVAYIVEISPVFKVRLLSVNVTATAGISAGFSGSGGVTVTRAESKSIEHGNKLLL